MAPRREPEWSSNKKLRFFDEKDWTGKKVKRIYFRTSLGGLIPVRVKNIRRRNK